MRKPRGFRIRLCRSLATLERWGAAQFHFPTTISVSTFFRLALAKIRVPTHSPLGPIALGQLATHTINIGPLTKGLSSIAPSFKVNDTAVRGLETHQEPVQKTATRALFATSSGAKSAPSRAMR